MTATIALALRNPKQIKVTLRQDLLVELQQLAEYEGRSLSNLCAYLIERAYKKDKNSD